MIILFTIFILFLGYVFSHFLNKIKKLNFKNFSITEICSFSFIFGIIIFVVYLLIYGLLKSYDKIMLIPLYIISLVGIILFIIDFKNKPFLIFNKANDKKRKIINIIINILLIFSFIFLSFISLKSELNTPDEFSLWGREAKAIFNLKGYLSLNNSIGISYPLTMPLFYSGFYFFADAEKCNQARLISTIITMFFSILFICRSKRKNYNDLLAKLLILFYVNMNMIMIEISTTLYVDTFIMLLYSLGFLYLCDYITEKKKDNIILFIILNSFVCCIKPDGIYLSIISIFTFALFIVLKRIFFRVKINKNDIKIVLFSIIFSGVCYFIYQSIYKMLARNQLRYIAADAYEVPRIKLDILNQSIDNGAKQMLTDPSVISFIVIIITLVYLLLKKGIRIEKSSGIKIFLCSMCFIFNLLFLYLAFIYKFGGEGVLAPSIIRYMTRVTPLIFEIILVLHVNLEGYSNEKNSSSNVNI